MKEQPYRGINHMRTIGEWYWKQYVARDQGAFAAHFEGDDPNLYGKVFENLSRSFIQQMAPSWLQEQQMIAHQKDIDEVIITTNYSNKNMVDAMHEQEYIRNFPTPDGMLFYRQKNTYTLAAIAEYKIPDVRNLPKYQDQFLSYSDMVFYFRERQQRAQNLISPVLNIDPSHIAVHDEMRLLYVVPLDASTDEICFTYHADEFTSTLYFPLTANQIRHKVHLLRSSND